MKKGFTLIELSIVLVIIGLLIGGILVAKSMISNAKFQRMIQDMQKYEVSVNLFYSNYKGYPGDSPYFIPPGNGDNSMGNGAAGDGVDCTATGHYANNEGYQVFAHLSQSKMIDKTYSPFSLGAIPTFIQIAVQALVMILLEMEL